MLKTAAVTIFTAISLLGPALADSPAPPDDVKATKYRSMQIDGLAVAYREAGPPDAPTVLLLHGFPSSSRMYQRLFPLLSDRYHLVAPDYVGFGHSDAPDPSHFDYIIPSTISRTSSDGSDALCPVHAGLRRADRFQAGAPQA